MARYLSESDLDLVELYAVRMSYLSRLDSSQIDVQELKSVLSEVRLLVDELRELRRLHWQPAGSVKSRGDSKSVH